MDFENYKDFIKFDDLSKEETIAFNTILRNLYRKRGVDFRQYRPNCLRRRIIVGMHDANVNSFFEYLAFLNNNPGKYDDLVDRITINVSEFFRNPGTFNVVLERVIPAIVKAKQKTGSRKIRIWSSGCATGEEPYSLAILMKEALSGMGIDMGISIFATDIDRDALEKAGQAHFNRKTLKLLKGYAINGYFDKQGKDKLSVKPEIKNIVKFMHHNMISDEPLIRIDLIFCRNVIIYFNRELQRKVYDNFYRSLVPGGFLVAGKTESVMDIEENQFEIFDLNERILRKKRTHRP